MRQESHGRTFELFEFPTVKGSPGVFTARVPAARFPREGTYYWQVLRLAPAEVDVVWIRGRVRSFRYRLRFRPGRYRGRTRQGRRLSFRLNASGTRIS